MDWKGSVVDVSGWGEAISRRSEKERIAAVIASKAQDGDIIGAGSGSTSWLAIVALAERVKREKLHIRAIPTSHEIALTCARLGIPLTTLTEHRPDWSFDGADEIDPRGNLLKGRGGAMFKEKLVINASPKTYILADSSKQVARLGAKFPVPVEIVPGALCCVVRALQGFSPVDIQLRKAGEGKDGPVITENGNFILDVRFDSISDGAEKELKGITGVIESGLFMGYTFEFLTPS